MKLYRVVLKGMKYSATGTSYGISYVVANDSAKAYETLRKFLDKNNYGFRRDREMESIELIADMDEYGDCGTMLFL